MRASSIAYSAEIRPEPNGRRLVIACALLLALAACVILVSLPLPGWIRVLLCVAWTGMAARELRRLQVAWHACRRLRFSGDGQIEVLTADAGWVTARLLPGSLLLQNAGWMHLQTSHAGRFGELLFRPPGAAADWRRLQVIWRHVGAWGGSC